MEPSEVLQAAGLDGEAGQLWVSGHFSEASRGQALSEQQSRRPQSSLPLALGTPDAALALWGRGEACLGPLLTRAKPLGAQGAALGLWGWAAGRLANRE